LKIQLVPQLARQLDPQLLIQLAIYWLTKFIHFNSLAYLQMGQAALFLVGHPSGPIKMFPTDYIVHNSNLGIHFVGYYIIGGITYLPPICLEDSYISLSKLRTKL